MSNIAPPSTRDTEMARRHFINPPPGGGGGGGDLDSLKAEFARRLQHLMTEKGWNQSDMARAAAKFMPDKKFNRDNISLYVRGVQLPGPVRLKALTQALGAKREDLLPPGAVATVEENTPPLSMKTIDQNNVWLQINQAVPLKVAMQIVALLGQATNGTK